MPIPIQIIQGGQWGSEAKGAVAAELCRRNNTQFAVRTGTINAGHTVYYTPRGQEHAPPIAYKMQTLPTGWVNPGTKLIVGPGAFIHPKVLHHELKLIGEATGEGDGIFSRVYVDRKAGLHLDSHTQLATEAGRHHLMGATGKGCSEAVMAKMRGRGTSGGMLFVDWLEATGGRGFEKLRLIDTVSLLHDAYDGGGSIQLEGTQGSLLDLHLGPYPYTTHKQTQASQWVSEAGLAPGMAYETILVCRTFPIRVAGNSGPMSYEISWLDLAREINAKLGSHSSLHYEPIGEFALSAFEEACKEASLSLHDSLGPDRCWRPETWTDEERQMYRVEASEIHKDALSRLMPAELAELDRLFERTTVTNKLRRIARFSAQDVRWSCRVNRPSAIALTFVNYVHPELWGLTTDSPKAWTRATWAYARSIGEQIGVPVEYQSFGPLGENLIGPLTA